MFASAVPMLMHATPILSASVDAFLREGDFAEALEHIQQRYSTVEIGSYPFNRDGRLGATLVARGTERALLTKVVDEIVAAITGLGGETQAPLSAAAPPRRQN